MEYRRLGNSGLQVSTVGLGTNNFGRRLEYERSEVVIKASLDNGINFIDTANIYSMGESEEHIGRALAGNREAAVIATKGGGQMQQRPHGSGNSRKHITSEVEASLKRLQTDYIDLYQIHFPDNDTPIEETLRALDDLIRAGKILYIGSSNFAVWQEAEAAWTSRQLGLNSFISTQPEYSLINRDVERELIPFSVKYNIGIIPYFPLAGGVLTGKYTQGQEPPEGTRMSTTPANFRGRFMNERTFAIADVATKFAEERGHTTVELAIAWLLAQPQVASVIAGATRPEQVEANAKAADWTLTADEVTELNEKLAALG
ncbi:MAG: aldo/keto reductase [Dehalococcoidia bacterium]|nr:aldo/keto reductase [Dehalococcoidia bacterium]